MTDGLADFLLQRIAEDEGAAKAATPGPWETRSYWFKSSSGRSYATITGVIYEQIDAEDGVHIARHDPARVLAECDAHRRIVERYQKIQSRTQNGDLDERLTLGWVLQMLALPFVQHPDFRREWLP